MNWKLFTHTAGSLPRAAARRTRFRPRLDTLEDRTLLTVGTFYLDDTASSLALSGNVAGQALQQQGPGSLTTSYEGSIEADFDLQAGTIQLTPNSDAVANNSGNWQPMADGTAGSAPANYGGQIDFLGTALAALRNLEVSAFDAAAVTLTPNGDGTYNFPAQQTLAVYAGSAAYSHPILGHGTYDLTGQSTQNQADQGVLTDNGDGSFALTLPVNVTLTFDISGIQAVLNITGSVTGNFVPGNGPGSSPGGPGRPLDIAAGVSLTHSTGTPVTISVPRVSADLGTLNLVRSTDSVAPLPNVATHTETSVLPSGTVSASPAPVLDPLALNLAWGDGFTF